MGAKREYDAFEEALFVPELEAEIERLQELHRRTVEDIRKFQNRTFMSDGEVLDEMDKLLNKISNRSRMALPKEEKNL